MPFENQASAPEATMHPLYGSEKHHNAVDTPAASERTVDESYKLLSTIRVTDPTLEEARRIRNKLLWRITPFLCIGYILMYTDKQTLGSSSILGIMSDAHLDANQYNWLSSIFYFGYMAAEFPQTWALQRYRVGKWLAGNLVVWGAILLLHIPCTSFGALFAVRLLLGVAEACVVPSLLLIMSMFFTYQEQGVLMLVMWSVGNTSPVVSGLLSYGVLWIDTGSFAPWRWLMLFPGTMTILFGIATYFLLPESPVHAPLLTRTERAQAVLRVKTNRSGIEQKVFKKTQFLEAIKDPKTWLFAAHAFAQELANGTTNQLALLINSFGFTTLHTTLLGGVYGLCSFVFSVLAATALFKTRNARAWVALVAYIPTALSSILLISLPSSNPWGLLIGLWIRSAVGVPYGVVMIWAANASAGHTKKTTVIALYHIGYGLGNIISPQLFRPQWRPRYKPTWIFILVVTAIVPALIVITLRFYLARKNRRRDDMSDADADTNFVDLTDRQNLKLYVRLW